MASLVAAPAWRCGAAQSPSPGDAGKPIEAVGRTQPAPGRSGTVAPVVLHPVIEVLATPGQRVKKGQPLVKHDDDEPQADVRAKKAALDELKAGLAKLKAQPREQERAEARALLESARVGLADARRYFSKLEEAWPTGGIPERRYHEAKTAVLRAEAEERAAVARLDKLLKYPVAQEIAEMQAKVEGAKAALESAQAELEHYTIPAPIDGVVTRLDVNLGTVSRPGTVVYGEVLDVRELDVRCDLSPVQAARVKVGQAAELWQDGDPESRWSGRVVNVSLAADPRSGRIPVLVRVSNPQERLRCYVEVRVRFGNGQTAEQH
jgi:multidrug resistance efflux pump